MAISEEDLRKTGEWWADPWWLEDNWVEVTPRSIEEVTQAFDYLKTVFTAEWCRSYSGNYFDNVFIRSIFYRAYTSREFMLRLSARLRRIQGIPGSHIVINGLRSGERSESSAMELDIADCFLGEGFRVEFPIPKPSKGKMPDIRVAKGSEQIAIECKRLEVGRVTAWLDAAYDALSHDIMNAASSAGLLVKFNIVPEVSEHLIRARSSEEDSRAAARKITKFLLEQIEIARQRDVWPALIAVVGLGQGIFWSSEIKEGSSVSFSNTLDPQLFKRMLSNALTPAAEQLQNEAAPGLVVIHARDIPSGEYLSDYIRLLMNRDGTPLSKVVGVLVLPWQGWFHRIQPHLITNPLVPFNWETSSCADVLRNHFDPIIT